jgi:hypothetical protein
MTPSNKQRRQSEYQALVDARNPISKKQAKDEEKTSKKESKNQEKGRK